MKSFFPIAISLLLLFIPFNDLTAQGNYLDRGVNVRAIVSENPAKIQLVWDNSSFAQATTIYRKKKSDATFPTEVYATLPAGSNSYTDLNVVSGVQYDYTLVQQATFTTSNNMVLYAWGGISAGIKIELAAYKGKLLLYCDSLLLDNLSEKIKRFEDDLTEEGWVVETIQHKAKDTSARLVKQVLRSWYLKDPIQAKSVILIGNIPVPYSGHFGVETTPPDGHVPDHNGAWAADAYYAVMNENLFTDFVTNENGITRAENKNKPGDGKFDQSFIPGPVQLQIGRIDMSRLPQISLDYVGKTARYLDKNHAYRNKDFSVPNRIVFEDRLNLLGTEAPGRLHVFQSSLFHKDSILNVSNTFFQEVKQKPYLWSGVTSSAGYTSINGIGGVSNFNDTVWSVFSNYFGSYFVDWDIPNNFLRGAIAGPGYTLTSIWSGRPIVHFHHMALGENIGFSLKHSQENGISSSFMGFYPGAFQNSIHMSMHGDPSLRLHTLTPPSNPIASPIDNKTKVQIEWIASPEPGIMGYKVFRSDSESGPYLPLNAEIISTTNFIDPLPRKGSNYYMVRTVKLENTPSGTYYNYSQGRRVSIDNIDGTEGPNLITANIDSETTLSIYPNPASSLLHFEWNNAEKATIEVLDINGRVLFTKTIQENLTTISVESLTNGVYILKVKSERHNSAHKWIKQ